MTRKSRTWVITLVLALLLSGCNIETDRTEKPGPDWSRALYVGRANVRQAPALDVGPDGHVHLAWCDQELQYAHIDERARVLVNHVLDIKLPNPRRPQIIIDDENRVHLAWLSLDQDVQTLYYVSVAADGAAGPPLQLSAPPYNVLSFQMFIAPSGELFMVWAGALDNAPTQIAYAKLSAPQSSAVLVAEGTDPHILVDERSTVHLSWMIERGFTSRTVMYAAVEDLDKPEPSLVPADGQKLTDFEFSESGVYNGPVIGVDKEQIYVLWSVQNLGGGLTPTAAFSYYATFPLGRPTTAHPRGLMLPTESRPEYNPYTSPYGFTQLRTLDSDEPAQASSFCNSPATVSALHSELPVAISLMVESTAQSQIQVATALLSNGNMVGYQLASRTEGASLLPALAADTDANLHMAWIDTAGFQQFNVYYATTAPDAREWLDRTSTEDIVIGAAELIWGVLSGIGLLPIAGIWTFPALVWVVVFFIATGKEEMERLPTKLGFAGAVLIYVGFKILMLPGLFRGTPFLHIIPRALATPLGIAIPVLILSVALGVVVLANRRAERATIFKSFFVFALIDVLLTITLYAPGFFDPTA